MNPFKVNLIWNYSSLIFLAISGITINIVISIFYSPETLPTEICWWDINKIAKECFKKQENKRFAVHSDLFCLENDNIEN